MCTSTGAWSNRYKLAIPPYADWFLNHGLNHSLDRYWLKFGCPTQTNMVTTTIMTEYVVPITTKPTS